MEVIFGIVCIILGVYVAYTLLKWLCEFLSTLSAFFFRKDERKALSISTLNNNAQKQIKSKNVAVVLAAVFGFWAWLYVFDDKENRWKFWLNLCLTLVTVGIWGLGAWVWAIVDMVGKPVNYFENYAVKDEQKQ